MGLGANRGGETRAPGTLRTRFILPMWIMKPSVQAMSEGEWPPPTTFTRLFCCLASASTCQGNTCVSPGPGVSVWGSPASRLCPPRPLRLCLPGAEAQATPGRSQRERPGSRGGGGGGEARKQPKVGLPMLPRAATTPDHIPLQGRTFSRAPATLRRRPRLLMLPHGGLRWLLGWNEGFGVGGPEKEGTLA